MRKIMVLILTVFVLAGCAGRVVLPPTPQTKEVVESDYDTVWEAVIQLFAEKNWPIKTIEKDSGVIRSEGLTVSLDHLHSKNFECQKSGWLATEAYKTVEITIFVREKSENRTELLITTRSQKLDYYGQNSWWVDCVSLGDVETEVRDEIVSRVGRIERNE